MSRQLREFRRGLSEQKAVSDGFRMMVRRDAGRIHVLTRNGHDWTARSAAAKVRANAFLIDGEAVVCDDSGLAHARGRSELTVKLPVAAVVVWEKHEL